MTHSGATQPVYLPDNEPYLGRESVFHFDQVITSCLETNALVAGYTHQAVLSDLQRAACEIIPQGVNLSLAIRELVRQGYLFAGLVLMRPLIERAATISYLHERPEAIEIWKRGWVRNERPGLKAMLAVMSGKADTTVAEQICGAFGQIVHGNPAAARWNLVDLGDAGLGYSVGKVIDNPDLCDFICFQSYCYLIVLMGMMAACFPDALAASDGTSR